MLERRANSINYKPILQESKAKEEGKEEESTIA
jgi:hypothetical protein